MASNTNAGTAAQKKTAAKTTLPAARTTAETPVARSTGIRTRIMMVGPKQAEKWLEGNVSNRRLSARTVDMYARDMVAGRWLMNGEAIQIADDGTLLNGQHRLKAVIKSGETVQMMVITGLPREAQRTMDAGKKRTAVDNLTLAGEGNTKALASIARRVALWNRGDRTFRDVVSFGEILDMLEEHPEIRRSAEIGERVNRSFKPLAVSVLGTSHYLLNQVSPEDTPWFFGAIEKGARLEEGDPVLTLRERIRSDREQGIKVNDVRAIGYVVRAWNAHREGRKLQRMQHAIGEPIPDII